MIVALNNKCNLGKDEFIEYQEKLSRINTYHQVIVCPTFLNINLYRLNKFSLGAQNVSCTTKGAYTGEIAAEDLKKSKVEYCIVGHSERREYQKETNIEINEKIKRLQENGITPILCVGETKEEREQNKQKDIVQEELLSAIKDIPSEEDIIIAYEPIWSIGTGIIPTNEEIKEMLHFIRSILPSNKILYGGSANEGNIDTLKEIKEIDGYLVGGLSLKPESLQLFLKKLEM